MAIIPLVLILLPRSMPEAGFTKKHSCVSEKGLTINAASTGVQEFSD
jgi:hypothetical protein